jgi:hypothetical protein
VWIISRVWCVIHHQLFSAIVKAFDHLLEANQTIDNIQYST